MGAGIDRVAGQPRLENCRGGARMQARSRAAVFAISVAGWIAVTLSSVHTSARPVQTAAAPAANAATAPRAVLDTYCVTCHNQRLRTAGLALDSSGCDQSGCERRGVGAGHRKASRPRHAAAGAAAAGRRDLSRDGDRAGGRNRSRLGGQSEPRPHQRGTSSESHRIQQRDP